MKGRNVETSKRQNGELERVQVVCRVAVPVEAPGRVLVVPWGTNERFDGQSFVVDQAAADSIVAAYREQYGEANRMLFDYEHHSRGGEFAAPDGKVVAAGWIDGLEAVPGEGIYAQVEWTPQAAAHIRNKEYRFVSPVVWVSKLDDRALALDTVGLTNTPAIRGIRPLVNKETVFMDERMEWARGWLGLPITATAEEIIMELEKLVAQFRALLGANAGETAEEVVSSIKKRLSEHAAARLSICKAVGVAEDATDEALLTACKAKAARPDPNEFVPASKHDALAAELATLKQERQQEKASEFVANAIKAGKITADDGEMWTESFLANSQKATERMAKLPVRFAPDGTMLANASRGPAASRETDPILANADRFDPARLDEHRRILAAAKDKNVSYVEAMKLVGAM